MNHFLLAVFQFSALWSPLACLCVNNKCISHQRHRGWCLRSAEHKEAVFISVFVQSNTGSNSAFGDNAQPACNPFSWEICSQIRRCHRAYRASSRLLSFIWDDILIFISARLIHEGMCTGASYLPPGPCQGDDSGAESTLRQCHFCSTSTRFSSCPCIISASWLCRQLLCGEKCEPSPWRSWYVSLKWTHADIIYCWPAAVVIFFSSSSQTGGSSAARCVDAALGDLLLMGLMSFCLDFSPFIQQRPLFFRFSALFSRCQMKPNILIFPPCGWLRYWS